MTNKKVKCEFVAVVFAITLMAAVALMPLKYAEAQNEWQNEIKYLIISIGSME